MGVMYTPIPNLSDKDIIRFWSKVNKSDNDICWEFKVWNNNPIFYAQKQWFRACRIAYYLQYNVDPKLLLVCHICDNPKCMNGSHLFLGTYTDNRIDMLNKNRYNPIIDPSPLRKLTKQQADEIRELRRTKKLSAAKLGNMFNVSRGTIDYIIYNRTYLK